MKPTKAQVIEVINEMKRFSPAWLIPNLDIMVSAVSEDSPQADKLVEEFPAFLTNCCDLYRNGKFHH